MFLRLLQFLRGYVVVAISGFSVERFINLAANKGIYMWNVRAGNGRTLLNVSIKGFRLLRFCSKKTGCKARIVKKTGLPFILFRYRKRKFLVLGAVVFLVLLYYLTSFIWLIDIEGNQRLEPQPILEKINSMGLKAGKLKYGVRLRDIERELLAAFPEISWVNVSIKGTRAHVSIVETIPETPVVDKGSPCDIVAAKDGLIVSVGTSVGRPVVRVGDVVRAGDILVSGEIVVGNDETGFYSYFVHARSEIRAKRYYEYEIDIPLSYIIKSFTGNVKRNYGIILFGREIYLENSESPFTNYEKTTEKNHLNFGREYPLPAVCFVEKYREFIPITVQRSIEEAEIMGRTIVDARILRELPEDTEIAEIEFTFTPGGDVMKVYARVTAVESIGEPRITERQDP